MLSLQEKLHEKEMRLTDVQLEALASAHQLQQMQDTINQMKVVNKSQLTRAQNSKAYSVTAGWAQSTRPFFRDRLRDIDFDFWRKSAKTSIPHLYSVCWHSTTDRRIATRMHTLTPSMTPLRLINI